MIRVLRRCWPIGAAAVIAAGCGDSTVGVVSPPPPPPPPTLTQIILNPAAVTVQVGTHQQFSVTPVWANGVGTMPAVTFTATGGTIDGTGNFTAGSTTGAFRVIAQIQSPNLADTSGVDVSLTAPQPGATATMATFYGGSDVEMFRDAQPDPLTGGYCVTGNTRSANFPTTAGAAQSTFGGFSDAVVVCFNADGSRRAATMVGGPNFERAYALAFGPSGDIYIAGRAGGGLPQLNGGAQSSFAGGPASSVYGTQDGFVCRLNHALTQILQCTYVGGADEGAIRDMTVAPDGTVYWAGWYSGTGAPFNTAWTAGRLNPSPLGGLDGTVGRLSANLTTMLCATFLGGSGNEAGEPSVLALSDGSILDARISNSTDAPATPARSGPTDMLVTKVSSDCKTLVWSHRIGGSAGEFAETQTTALVPDGRIVVAFGTLSPDFPQTAGHAQASHGGNATSGATGSNSNYPGDCVIAVLSSTGTLQGATYLGGSAGEGCQGTAVSGNDIVVGFTTFSTNLTVTPGARAATKGPGSDGGIALIPLDLSRFTYVSYLGGEEGRCAAAGQGWMLACGLTDRNFAVLNPVQAAFGGGNDGWVVRFSIP